MSASVAKLQQFAEKNHIDLYIMVIPTKEDLYKYRLSDVFANINTGKSKIAELKSYLKQENDIDIIYPREIYLRTYPEFTHYKTDHHWTEFGAFLSYQELLKEIRKKHAGIKMLQENAFDTFYEKRPYNFTPFKREFFVGSDCNRLGLPSALCPLQDDYKYYNHKQKNQLQVKKGPLLRSYITHYPAGSNKNITLLGNSYSNYLLAFLPYNFKNFQLLRTNNSEKGVKNYDDMGRFEKHILDFKTDILVFCVSANVVGSLARLYED